MNKHQIKRKIKLLEAGVTEMDIARMLNVTFQAINNEMAGKKKSKRIREALSKITRTPMEKLFPEFYRKEDTRPVTHGPNVANG